MNREEEMGRRVKVACAARGWTMAELARRCEVHPLIFSRAMQGHTSWDGARGRRDSPLRLAAKALNIYIGALGPGGPTWALLGPVVEKYESSSGALNCGGRSSER